eukprot:Nk52_evm10s2039 gene=Nk52_evmTU10s2039
MEKLSGSVLRGLASLSSPGCALVWSRVNPRLIMTPRLFSSSCTCPQNQEPSSPPPPTPDFVTSVDVHNHKLTRKSSSKGEGNDQSTSRSVSPPRKSLIPETLEHMAVDEEFRQTVRSLKRKGQKQITKEEQIKRRRALDELGVPSFHDFLLHKHGLRLERKQHAGILQLNIGLYCNQACNHCHVESSPRRTKEMMNRDTVDRCLDLFEASSDHLHTLDITGGAPELNSQFRYLVESFRLRFGNNSGKEIIDRCNLTVLREPGQEDLAEFLAAHQVKVVASLPCYSTKNVNLQRGSGVFERSIEGLLELNRLGYGITKEKNVDTCSNNNNSNSGLVLDLVYNPIGAFLSPDQLSLEQKYKTELRSLFGIEFNNLFTITNMPIKRFADFLYRRGELKEYMDLLVRNFNPRAVEGLMCRDTISVRWDGEIYDCDFNQQLDLAPFGKDNRAARLSVFDIDCVEDVWRLRRIGMDNHCFGCTAGMGSSCGGATATQ